MLFINLINLGLIIFTDLVRLLMRLNFLLLILQLCLLLLSHIEAVSWFKVTICLSNRSLSGLVY